MALTLFYFLTMPTLWARFDKIKQYAYETTIIVLAIGDCVAVADDAGRIYVRDCTGLTSIYIPESVKLMAYDPFKGCTGLTKAEFASIESLCNIEFIGEESNPLSQAHHLFINGEEIIDLVIPNTITSIGSQTFSGCSSLKSMVDASALTMDGEGFVSGKPGDSFQLKAEIAPADVTLPYIYWRSTNPRIATVDNNGLVTFLRMVMMRRIRHEPTKTKPATIPARSSRSLFTMTDR